MNIEFKKYETIDNKTWDLEVLKRSKNLNALSHFIDYKCITSNLKHVGGIVYLDDQVLVIYDITLDLATKSLVAPSPVPMLSDDIDPLRVKKAHELYSKWLLIEHKIRFEGVEIFEKNCWELEEKNLQFSGERKITGFNMVIPLDSTEDDLLANFNRNHKRNIKKSIMQGQKVLIISNTQNQHLIEFYFDSYRKCHYSAAGRQTRNDASFDYMAQLIHEGISTLFVTVLDNEPIAFLYCDQAYQLSRGWSQATSLAIQEEIFPRTLLEWTAIKYFRNQGCSIYHLGSYSAASQKNSFPNEGYMEFKRRFEPVHRPIYSLDFWGDDYNER